MKPLNYSRQVLWQFSKDKKISNGKDDEMVALIDKSLYILNKAQKFMLPINGATSDDLEFRALDETEELNLPYPFISLEFDNVYEEGYESKDQDGSPVSKVVVLAEQMDGKIALTSPIYAQKLKMWLPSPIFIIPTTGYITRHGRGKPVTFNFKVMELEGHPSTGVLKDWKKSMGGQTVHVILAFLNVLQCSNVTTELIPPKRNFVGQDKRCTLPFDSYHILKIYSSNKNDSASSGVKGSHASPREHLRRGHIRLLQDGRRIWVNATIVNSGIGAIVHKDYSI